MTDSTPTTILPMSIHDGLESLKAYYDHIPVMLQQQKQVMTAEDFRILWCKLREERKRTQEKIRDLLWLHYVTMRHEKMMANRDETLIIC